MRSVEKKEANGMEQTKDMNKRRNMMRSKKREA